MTFRTAYVLLAACALLGLGCLHFPSYQGRIYSTPLTGAEGELMVPALVSTAEGMGLQVQGSGGHRTKTGKYWSGSVQVTLEDGTGLHWFEQSGSFVLGIDLAVESPESLRAARVRADQIWTLAVQARQANGVGATVVVQPQEDDDEPMAVPGDSAAHGAAAAIEGEFSGFPGKASLNMGTRMPAMPSAPAAGRSSGACTFSSDCASGHCRNNQCEGGAPGAPCTFSSDCPTNNCRKGRCEGGVSGAPCTFSSDCPSGRCDNNVCR